MNLVIDRNVEIMCMYHHHFFCERWIVMVMVIFLVPQRLRVKWIIREKWLYCFEYEFGGFCV